MSQFSNTLDALEKATGKVALFEAIKQGYQMCCESEDERTEAAGTQCRCTITFDDNSTFAFTSEFDSANDYLHEGIAYRITDVQSNNSELSDKVPYIEGWLVNFAAMSVKNNRQISHGDRIQADDGLAIKHIDGGRELIKVPYQYIVNISIVPVGE